MEHIKGYIIFYLISGLPGLAIIDLLHRYLYGESKWAQYSKETTDDTELGCFVLVTYLVWPGYLVYYVVVTIFTFLGRIFRDENADKDRHSRRF